MIFIGGSLGGSEALRVILRRLPPDFALPVAVVLHRHRDSDGMLVPMLRRSCVLRLDEVTDKEPIRPGRVYICPADYHLMVDGGYFALSTDDLVNFARPSIDVLLESGAEWERTRAVGVILTGSGTDGARGAQRIQEQGGQVLVQDPQSAEGPWMPSAAIAAAPGARVLPLTQLADALAALKPSL